MVERVGGYYVEAFKGARGVTQGDPLLPTIFNVVLDALVRHWVKMVLAEADKREGGTRVGTKLTYSTRTTAWWRCPTLDGYSGRLSY